MTRVDELQLLVAALDRKAAAGEACDLEIRRIEQIAEAVRRSPTWWQGGITRSQSEAALADLQRQANTIWRAFDMLDAAEEAGIGYGADLEAVEQLVAEFTLKVEQIGVVYEPRSFRR